MIPTYRQEIWVEEAIRSALSQDYPNLEVVVCDDASPDGTFTRASSFADPRLRVHRNPVNLGRVGNYRHLLFDLARGDWVLMLDGDDRLADSSFLRLALEAAQTDPDVVLICGGHGVETSKSICQHLPSSRDRVIMGCDAFFQWERLGIAHLAALYRRDLAIRLDFYKNNMLSADCESLLTLVLHGKVALLAKVVGVWRDHGGNASRGLDYATFANALCCFDGPRKTALRLGFSSRRLNYWKRRHVAGQVMTFFLQNLRAINDDQSIAAKMAVENLDRLLADYPPYKYPATLWLLGGVAYHILGHRFFRETYLRLRGMRRKSRL